MTGRGALCDDEVPSPRAAFVVAGTSSSSAVPVKCKGIWTAPCWLASRWRTRSMLGAPLWRSRVRHRCCRGLQHEPTNGVGLHSVRRSGSPSRRMRTPLARAGDGAAARRGLRRTTDKLTREQQLHLSELPEFVREEAWEAPRPPSASTTKHPPGAERGSKPGAYPPQMSYERCLCNEPRT